ncbi:MAG TPA: hypothetical protein RMH99_30540, partial [Sandaracinaceae bacterium LLY-WYZ-13_1]|nr:hypothetical protein [Sandaracinaceae bacterium LLY-WYZ-13_1]
MLDLDVTDRVGGCAPVGLAILASRPLLGLREAPGHRWIDPRPGAPDAPVLTLDPPLAGSPDGSHVAGRAPEADDELVVVGEGAAGARVVRRA